MSVIKLKLDYSEKSNNRRIKVQYGDETVYMSDPLTMGNSKLGKEIAIFDLLAGTSCINCHDCVKHCYAVKAQRQYPTVHDKRAINTFLARNNIKKLRQLIEASLTLNAPKFVRIHSSGDFVSQEYIDMWVSLAKEFPEIKFYTYTKVIGVFDFSKAEKHINIVQSVLPDGDINFGDIEYIKEKSVKYGIPICPVGITKGKGFKCGTDCTLCMHHDQVLFLQH